MVLHWVICWYDLNFRVTVPMHYCVFVIIDHYLYVLQSVHFHIATWYAVKYWVKKVKKDFKKETKENIHSFRELLSKRKSNKRTEGWCRSEHCLRALHSVCALKMWCDSAAFILTDNFSIWEVNNIYWSTPPGLYYMQVWLHCQAFKGSHLKFNHQHLNKKNFKKVVTKCRLRKQEEKKKKRAMIVSLQGSGEDLDKYEKTNQER